MYNVSHAGYSVYFDISKGLYRIEEGELKDAFLEENQEIKIEIAGQYFNKDQFYKFLEWLGTQ